MLSDTFLDVSVSITNSLVIVFNCIFLVIIPMEEEQVKTENVCVVC